MKRSEALDIIDDVLYLHELPLLQGISKEILGRLENAGMLPPDYITRLPNGLEVRMLDWEPEDEKK